MYSTNVHLRECLAAFGLVCPKGYFVAPCALHVLQQALSKAIMAVIGDGGLGKRNVMQLVHSCHDLQSYYPGIFKEIWKAVLAEIGKDGNMVPITLETLMKRPVLT